jgi:hypothetical protein
MIGPNLAGLSTISVDQTIPFTQYIRHVLPLDGYVFWLRTQQTTIQGSLHVGADKQQNEDETISVNRVIFTTGEEVQLFNAIQPNTIWVGESSGVRFAFSRSGPRFKAAGLFHYVGDAVYPAMETQLVDVGQQLSDATLVVSNSLPAWLTLASYSPVWLDPPNPRVTLFPSFAVPDNLPPPYGTVHVLPESTTALQAVPLLDRVSNHAQLATDRVRITLYGLTNDAACDFLDLVISFSSDTDVIGLMNAPIIRDEKRTQAELGILAMKKTIEFDVSYYQLRVNNIARQMVEKVIVTYLPQQFKFFSGVT